MQTLKLPRKVEADPRFPTITDLLNQTRRPLWEKSAHQVSELPWTESIESALSIAVRAGKIVLGVETAERVLAQEKRGLDALRAKQGKPPAHRVSRVLLVSNDGSERHYRTCEKLVREHGDRLLVIRLEVPASRMGDKLFGAGREIKAILIADREHVENVLLGLVSETS